MRTSVTWLNDYLDPPATAQEQAELLTNAGFPLDGEGVAENGEAWQEIEITSNRGDCLCHLGFAREIGAVSGRRLVLPSAKPPTAAPAKLGPAASSIVRVSNERPDLCPLYTARIIRGVTVRPSPDWLARRLVAAGHVPRNNLVDATNFVLFELGQPTHVFDLATLVGPEIRIRTAHAGERFLPIGDGASEIALRSGDLVIADRDRAVAIAGVKGGARTAVTTTTRDILVEAATFDPVTVRSTSRGLRIASDSSYRFERGVHPAEVDAAAERLVSLILELAGGELAEGSVRDGGPLPQPRRVALRPDRCRAVLGYPLPTATMVERLAGLGFAPQLRLGGGAGGNAEQIECTVPPRRLDVEREIDLIEEICRTHGLQHIPTADAIKVRVAGAQPRVAATRAVKDLLVSMGFLECVTHTLVSEQAAASFTPPGSGILAVDDERAGGEPALRASVLPSLLRVRRHNLDHGAAHLDLFEWASTFALRNDRHEERRTLALLVDALGNGPADRDLAARTARGAVERIARALAGPAAVFLVEPLAGADAPGWFEPAGRVLIDGQVAGTIGLVTAAALAQIGLERPVAAAELDLSPWLERYPPDTRAAAMPAFPAVDRDVSAIVAETVRWSDLAELVASLRLPELESVSHIATYRGKQAGTGRKSVSMRLLFRSAERTLRSEEVDGPIATLVATLRERLGAEIRTAVP